MFDKTVHAFITQLNKESRGKTPTSGTIYVATQYPAWKVKVMETLRVKHAEGLMTFVKQEDMKTEELKAQWKAVIIDLMKDPELRSYGKKVGPFAAFKRDEGVTAGVSALDNKVLFDEHALICEHLPYLKDKMKIDLQVSHADALLSPAHQRVAAEAEPRQPTLALDFGSSVKKHQQTIETEKKTPIEDLKELNAHLSTRSYFEGGPKPSHADLAQFKVTPFNFSSKEFPHVGRWYRHIASFTATQTSKW